MVGEITGDTMEMAYSGGGTGNQLVLWPGSTGDGSVSTADIDTDEPLYVYDSTGTCLGIHMGTFETDLLHAASADQEDFTSGWINGFCTFATDLTDPTGVANNAQTMTDSNDGTSRFVYVQPSASFAGLTANAYFQCSVFVKVVNVPVSDFYIYVRTTSITGADAYLMVKTDDMTTATKVGTTVADYNIQNCGNGWYRIWFVSDTSSDTNGTLQIGMTDTNTPFTAYTTDGRQIGIWGAQIVPVGGNIEHNCYPLPYCKEQIPQSKWNIPDAGGPSWLTGSNWTTNFGMLTSFYWRNKNDPNGSGTIDFDGSRTQYGMFMRNLSDSSAYLNEGFVGKQYAMDVFNNPGTDGSAASGTADLTDTTDQQHVMFTVSDGDLRVCANGGTVGSATPSWPWSESGPSDNYFSFGWRFDIGRQIGMIVSSITFYDSDTTDAEMQTLTTDGYPFPTAFSGSVAGDGGVMWPPRANDPRWTQLLTDSGITQSGNFTDDVKAALIALSGASGGSLDDLWKKTLAANGVTDISEPFLY